jgi:hypothetical protein
LANPGPLHADAIEIKARMFAFDAPAPPHRPFAWLSGNSNENGIGTTKEFALRALFWYWTEWAKYPVGLRFLKPY